MTIIYGIDTKKEVSTADVRDAIVECFTHAHQEALEELKDYTSDISEKDFGELKRLNVRQIVRSAFHKTGGDYDSPTKESIVSAMDALKDFAGNFRNKKIIEDNYKKIKTLVDLLK